MKMITIRVKEPDTGTDYTYTLSPDDIATIKSTPPGDTAVLPDHGLKISHHPSDGGMSIGTCTFPYPDLLAAIAKPVD
jgi:hypothetical protein